MRKPLRYFVSRILWPAALCSCTVSAAALQAPAQDAPQPPLAPTDVVLTVGDRQITLEEFEGITESLPPQFAGAVAQLGMGGFANQFANLLALAQEGEKLQIDERDTFRQMLNFQRTLILAQTTLNELAGPQIPVSQADIQSQYDAIRGELEEVHLRGIYIPFDPEPEVAEGQEPPSPVDPEDGRVSDVEALAKAESLRLRIEQGENIAELAQAESEHPTSASGGDFGFVKKNQFAPGIDSVVFALEPNQLSEPLRDRFGYFIFRLEERRTTPLDQVRQPIENGIRQQRMMDLLARLKATYPVTLDPRYFSEAPAPATLPAIPQQ